MAAPGSKVPVAFMPPVLSGEHSQKDFESVVESYVAKTNADQITRIKDFMTLTLEAECKKQDEVIKTAWETIDKALKAFNANRDKLIEIMGREEGQRRTRKAVELGGVDKLIPPTYQKIVDEITTARQHESNPMSPASLEAHSPGLSAISDSLLSPTFPAAVTAPTTAPAQPSAGKYTAKRSRPNLDVSTTAPPKRPKTDYADLSPSGPATAGTQPNHFGAVITRNHDLPGYDVEGKEYIFPYPMGSNFYYVLRCTGDKNIPSHTFKTNPLVGQVGRPAPAVDHYCNYRRCRGGHDGERTYSIEEIVRRWGHRVTGVDVKDAWVNAANERLRESETRKESTLANIPTGPRGGNKTPGPRY